LHAFLACSDYNLPFFTVPYLPVSVGFAHDASLLHPLGSWITLYPLHLLRFALRATGLCRDLIFATVRMDEVGEGCSSP
jgi:hypothetical protein